MKKRCVAILLALSMVLSGGALQTRPYTAAETSHAGGQADVIINIPDKVLKAEILDECDENGDGNITKSEMEKMTYLYVYGASDLTGLEYAINLKTLSLEGEELSDISVLSGLKNLETLSLDGRRLSDISA